MVRGNDGGRGQRLATESCLEALLPNPVPDVQDTAAHGIACISLRNQAGVFGAASFPANNLPTNAV